MARLISHVTLVADEPDGKVLRQVVVQFLQPTLEAGQWIVRLTAVVYYDGCIGASVVSAVQATVLLLAERVPDLEPADLIALLLELVHKYAVFLLLRRHRLHFLVAGDVLCFGAALVEDSVAVSACDACLANALVAKKQDSYLVSVALSLTCGGPSYSGLVRGSINAFGARAHLTCSKTGALVLSLVRIDACFHHFHRFD